MPHRVSASSWDAHSRFLNVARLLLMLLLTTKHCEKLCFETLERLQEHVFRRGRMATCTLVACRGDHTGVPWLRRQRVHLSPFCRRFTHLSLHLIKFNTCLSGSHDTGKCLRCLDAPLHAHTLSYPEILITDVSKRFSVNNLGLMIRNISCMPKNGLV